MNYKYLPGILENMPQQILKIEDDGIQVTINLSVDSKDKELYESWLTEGNTPLPADAPGE